MATKKVPLSLRINPALLKRVDEARGDVSRTRFVERTLEQKCDGLLEPRVFTPSGVDCTIPPGKIPPAAAEAVKAQWAERDRAKTQRASEKAMDDLVGPVVSPGVRGPRVKTHQELAMERQRKMNEKRS